MKVWICIILPMYIIAYSVDEEDKNRHQKTSWDNMQGSKHVPELVYEETWGPFKTFGCAN